MKQLLFLLLLLPVVGWGQKKVIADSTIRLINNFKFNRKYPAYTKQDSLEDEFFFRNVPDIKSNYNFAFRLNRNDTISWIEDTTKPHSDAIILDIDGKYYDTVKVLAQIYDSITHSPEHIIFYNGIMSGYSLLYLIPAWEVREVKYIGLTEVDGKLVKPFGIFPVANICTLAYDKKTVLKNVYDYKQINW